MRDTQPSSPEPHVLHRCILYYRIIRFVLDTARSSALTSHTSRHVNRHASTEYAISISFRYAPRTRTRYAAPVAVQRVHKLIAMLTAPVCGNPARHDYR